MSQELLPQDERLIRELYDKLEWITFEADDDEFSAEQVNAIVTLLDSMDPEGIYDEDGIGESIRALRDSSKIVKKEEPAAEAPADPLDVDAAFSRFKQRFNISEAEMSHKVKGDKINISEDDLSDSIHFDGEDFMVKLAEFRKKETAEAAVASDNEADNSESSDSDADTSTRGASASPNAQTAHQEENADPIDSVANGGAGEKALQKNGSEKGKKNPAKSVGLIIGALIVAAAVFTGLSVGTSAVAEKSFFEIVRDGVNGMRITVTGNEPETAAIEMWEAETYNNIQFESWEEMESELGGELKKPTYIPEGLNLTNLYAESGISYTSCRAVYGVEDSLIIMIKIYENEYFDETLLSSGEWLQINSPKYNQNNALFYEGNDEYKSIICKDNVIISISYRDFDELIKITNSVK